MSEPAKRYLEGKVAVVTGSGQGIGRGIAQYFARQGAKVVTNNRKPGSESASAYRAEDMTAEEYRKMLTLKGDAEGTAALIRAEGGEAVPFYGDVSDFGTAGRLIECAMDSFGRIDILVNNAAGLGHGGVMATNEKAWDYMTSAKLKGAFNTMHHAVPHMLEQGSGRILNCASDAWTGVGGLLAYSAGNAGVVGLTRSAAEELLKQHITANVYCPQADSPGHVVEFNQFMRELGVTDPPAEKDHGDPLRIAPFLAYLCTPMADEITGQVFSVKASGKVERYAVPQIERHIWKQEGVWTLEELDRAVKAGELGEVGWQV